MGFRVKQEEHCTDKINQLIELWETFLYMLDAEDDTGASSAQQQQTAALTAAAAAPSSSSPDAEDVGGILGAGPGEGEGGERSAGGAAPATATDVALEQDA